MGATIELLGVFVAIVAGAIAYFKWKFTYWEKRGLETITPTIPFGSIKGLFLGQHSFGDQFQEVYKQFKARGLKHGGIYLGWKPSYVPIDPDIIKHVMQNDFQHFVNHGFFVDEEHDPLNANLFNLEDAKWRNMRVKLTPTFTSGKMKMMFQTFVDCTVGLKEVMGRHASDKIPVDAKEILGCFTTDIIGSCAFGIQCNSLKDPKAEFRTYGRRVFDTGTWDKIKVLLMMTLPHSLLKMIHLKNTKADVERFFTKVIRDTVEYREKNNVYRKDFMHLLLQLKNRGAVTDDAKLTDDSGQTSETLTMNELTAQAFVFFLAGFETSSTTMTFASYELATNPDVQDKVREEVRAVLAKHNNELTYEGIMEMTYLDKVLNETLRKYPPLPLLPRKCTKDYTVPNTSVRIEEGTDVAIPVLGIHRDPEYYPDPEKFDPERFSEENKLKRPPFTWIPFGEGPRLCIGLRFGMLQSKVGIATLIKNYRIKLNKRTKLPLEFHKPSFILAVDGGIWLDVERLD